MKSVQVVARGRAEFIDVAKPEVRPGYVGHIKTGNLLRAILDQPHA
jgi:hypothetical protein